jgi:predicted CoA-binding protein
MQTMQQAAAEFLASRRIAVTGVSRSSKNHGANTVFKRLRDRGYEVFPVNPHTDQVEGAHSYPDLKSIPGGVDGVVIATAPQRADSTMHECDELGIKHVWMHRSSGEGSVDHAAADYGRDHGITVIEGGCPLMFSPVSDVGHKVMRVIYRGHVPKTV